MTDLGAVIQATGGPFFEARWRRSEKWDSEQYRLFRGAKERCREEFDKGADLAYVNHLITDELVFSLCSKTGPVEDRRLETAFEDWCELVSYLEGIDTDLDADLVPSKDDTGKRLFLKERVALLHAVATRRSQLSYKLFKQFDEEYGNALRNGYFPDLKPLWDETRKEFGVP